jgi:hypothetical protein
MLERTDVITNEVLEPITFIVEYPLYPEDQDSTYFQNAFNYFPVYIA